MGHQAVLGFMDLDVETGRDGGDILLADTKTAGIFLKNSHGLIIFNK